jgi:hypothetical protein
MDASQRLEFLGYHFERHHGDYRFSSHPRLAEIGHALLRQPICLKFA